MTIPLVWPFAQWGLEKVGPMLKSSSGGHIYLLVAVDKFTKWIEVIPATNQTTTTAVKFFKGITCRFGVPHSIIIDNGTNLRPINFVNFVRTMASGSVSLRSRTLRLMGKWRGSMV
jgi:hypothetical protein